MKLAAVSTISFFDNIILQKIVPIKDKETWKDAYIKAMDEGLMYGSSPDTDRDEWILSLPDDLEEARKEMSNGEMDLCITFYNI